MSTTNFEPIFIPCREETFRVKKIRLLGYLEAKTSFNVITTHFTFE